MDEQMKRNFGLIVTIVMVGFLFGCNPSESDIQTAIVQTQVAKPTETLTATSTDTQTPSPTLAPTSTETPEPLPLEKRIIGKWSGAMTNKNGDKLPAVWTFIDGGVMVIELVLLDASYGAEWYVEGNRIHIISELDPNVPTYRDAEFITDDVVILTKEEANIKETWSRAQEE